MPRPLAVEPTASCVREPSTDLPDAFVHYASLCEGCSAQSFSMVVQVGNRGTARIGADTLSVEVLGEVDGVERSLDTLQLSDAIPSGQVLAGIALEVQGASASDFDAILIRVADVVDDCEPGNDVMRFVGPFCTHHMD
jgi:hypothetical protein